MVTCNLPIYQFNSNFTSCGEEFVNNYNWFAFAHGSIFAALLLFSMLSFGKRLHESNFKFQFRDPALCMNVYIMCASISGMCQFINFNGLKWDLASCMLPRISLDLTSSFIYLTLFQIIFSSDIGFIAQGLQKDRSKIRQSAAFFITSMFQFELLLNGIIPDAIYCSTATSDNITKNNVLALLYISYALFGTLFLTYKVVKYVNILRRKLKGEVAPTQHVANKTHFQDNEEDRKIFIAMYKKFSFYAVLAILTSAYQLFSGFILINNDIPPMIFTADTIFSPFNNLFVYIQLVVLATFTYNNNVKSSANGVAYKTGLTLLFSIWAFVFLLLTILIFTSYVVYLVVSVSFLVFFINVAFVLQSGNFSSFNRDEELGACINLIGGRRMRLRNVIFILFEVASMTFLSLDALYLWWAPPMIKEISFYLFNGVTPSNVDYLKYLLPFDVSNAVITNCLISYIFILILLMSSTNFLRLPKLLYSFLNIVSYLTFDLFVMLISSVLLRRLKCHDSLQGKVLDHDSLIGNGYLIGYSEIPCNTNNLNYIYSLTYLTVVIILLIGYGLSYFLLIRNKTANPSIWDIPGFQGLKMLLKFTMVSGINLTPKDYFLSPWIRASINLFCLSSITFASYKLMPCLGPQAEVVNLYRTSAYSFAFFCSLMSFVSLILLYTCGLENEVAANFISVLTVVVPILGCSIFFYFSKRRVHKKIDAIKKVCAMATSNESTIEGILVDYNESIEQFGKEGNPFAFLPALALHYSSNSVILVSSTLTSRLRSFINLSDFDRSFIESGGIHSAFSFLEKASHFPEGSQVIKRKFLSLLSDCLIKCEKYYCTIDLDAIQVSTLSTKVVELVRFSQIDNIIVPLLEFVVIPLCLCLISVCQISEFYVNEVRSSLPQIFKLILKLRNFDLFVLESGYINVGGRNANILSSSVVLFNTLLNIFHDSRKSLMINLIVRRGSNGDDNILNSSLKKVFGKLNQSYEEEKDYATSGKLKLSASAKNKQNDTKTLESSTSPTSTTSESILGEKGSKGASPSLAVRSIAKKMKKISSYSFTLHSNHVFQKSNLSSDAFIIFSSNNDNIVKESLIELVESIFGNMIPTRRKSRMSVQFPIFIDNQISPVSRQENKVVKEISNNLIIKRKNEKIIVVIGIFQTKSSDSNSQIEMVKQDFMKEWNRKENTLNKSIQITIDIKQKNNAEADNKKVGSLLLEDGGKSLLEEAKDYMNHLTSMVDKEIQERRRKKELLAVHGIIE